MEPPNWQARSDMNRFEDVNGAVFCTAKEEASNVQRLHTCSVRTGDTLLSAMLSPPPPKISRKLS